MTETSTRTSSQDFVLPRLNGKVAIVTGGASGIGEGTSRVFVQHDAKVIIADVQDALGHSLVESINKPDAITYVHCDVTNEDDVKNTVDLAVAKHGKLDVIFSNAGIPGKDFYSILSAEYQDFKNVVDVNLFGAFLCAKHAARVMIPAKKGSIVFTSSIASVTCGNINHAYLASKHAVVGLTKNLCIELGQHGIRVNCVSPFAVATPLMIKGFNMKGKEEAEEFVSRVATLKGTVLEAVDVAEAVVFLASDESKYLSGQNLVIDGGYSLTNAALIQEFKKKLAD